MPQSVQQNDATNFLKDGYVSRAQATRDGAGNIKLYEDTTELTNRTIMVEPVTSQFSVETALKLFETRFEYFKFPVQTVVAASLDKINESIDAEVANTLAGVSFEQDVISRRLELVPLVEGSSNISWAVPIPWVDSYYVGNNETPTNGNTKYNSESTSQKSLFMPSYNTAFATEVRSTLSGNQWINRWAGLQTIPLSNGNSPRPGWIRITPEMLTQIRSAGQLKGGQNPNTNPWKRNIKLKFSVNWNPESGVVDAFASRNFIYNDNSYVNLYKGVCLFASLETGIWHDDWFANDEFNEPMGPIFVQSTSNSPINMKNNRRISTNQTNLQYESELINSYNPDENVYQSMVIEYILDSRYLLRDIDSDPDINEPAGKYKEYGWKLMCNHPVQITDCFMEVSYEELPDDYVTNTQYAYASNQPRAAIINEGNKKSNQFKTLYAKYTYTADFLGGVRKVIGKNILACNRLTTNAIGNTDINGNWSYMCNWSGKKWLPRESTFVTLNQNLLRPNYFKTNWNPSEYNKLYDIFSELDNVVVSKIAEIDNSGNQAGPSVSDFSYNLFWYGTGKNTGNQLTKETKFTSDNIPSVWLDLSYQASNKQPYPKYEFQSTGVTGLTLTIPPGILGSKNTGPSAPGMGAAVGRFSVANPTEFFKPNKNKNQEYADFDINVWGQSFKLSVPIGR